MISTRILQSINIHVVITIVPPKCVLKGLHRVFSAIFVAMEENKHWTTSEKICFPKLEVVWV